MIKKFSLIKNDIGLHNFQRIESIISFLNLIIIIKFFVVLLFIGISFPLEKIIVKNIIFESISKSTYKVISDSNLKNEVIRAVIENYIYYRETFPNKKKNSLIYFENKKVYEKRIKFDKKFLEIISSFKKFKRNIKIDSINFLLDDSITAKIFLEDIAINKNKESVKKKEYRIALKFKYFDQKINEKEKYINPLGLKIINYEITQ